MQVRLRLYRAGRPGGTVLPHPKKPPTSISIGDIESRSTAQSTTRTVHHFDPLLTADEVAMRLKVSKDWVWDHSSRKAPRLPVIRMGDGTLRYRSSRIEDFISERERLSERRDGTR